MNLSSLRNLVKSLKEYFLFKYFKIISRKISYNQNEIINEGYYSQAGQDKFVSECLFKNTPKGTFVDIGANDGVKLSNTLHFENKGWNGLAIEPHPKIYKKLISNRNCTCLNLGITSEKGTKIFRSIDGPVNMLSGFVDLYDKRHDERISHEINLHGGKYEDIEVPCNSLHGILEVHNIKHIDFLSIDVEGAELEILRTLDFKRVNVSVITVENNYKDFRIPRLLQKSGFRIIAMIGDDNVFLNKTFK